MLTTHQLVQSATSSFLPWLLLLIAWYSIAASLRAFADLFLRFRRKRKIETQINHRLQEVAKAKEARKAQSQPKAQDTLVEMQSFNDDEVTAPINYKQLQQQVQSQLQEISEDLEVLEKILGVDLKESMLFSHEADNKRLFWNLLEGILFAGLAGLAMFQALPLPKVVLLKAGWLHLAGPFLFLCFILRARRLLMLVPLTALSLVSWQAFAFVTSFQKTLETATTIATVDVEDMKKRRNSNQWDVTFRVKFAKGGLQHRLTMPIDNKRELRFDAISYRVPSEVLLFGGKNLLTLQSVFTDAVAPSKAVRLHKPNEPFPLYRWEGITRQKQAFTRQKKKAFVWLWKQLFQYHETHKGDQRNRWQQKAVTCPPPRAAQLHKGQRFVLKHRHVAGIECHALAPPRATTAPAPR